MRADVDPELVVVAATRCAVATFDKARWLELGALSGSRDEITDHPRLLRSLSFGDDDYDGCALDVLR